jgi:hypothetical protein
MLVAMTVSSANGYQLVSAVFLRLLGAIYLVAFVTIGIQVEGLVGSQGIQPAAHLLAGIAGHAGPERFFELPTLFWLDASDTALTCACTIGALCALLILLNLLTRPALVTAFALYLSLYQVTQPFLNFQWDTLLLESGFLAIFLTPGSRVVIWLFRWLLFRLRFESGLSKLVSGDPAWSGLTALNHYFEVQPLPNPVAWYANQVPEWLLRTGTGGTLFVELLVPFMMFLPRRWRFAAAWLTILWQVLIILTSNHNWINFLTILLCLFLFDDRALQHVLPARLQSWLAWRTTTPARSTLQLRRFATGTLGVFILVCSLLKGYEMALGKDIPGVTGEVLKYAGRYGMVNVYHVFPTMTTQRIELEISGSIDGREWRTYHFRYKPDELDARPQFIIPYQPRLDWQMWFVTLSPRNMPWFANFLQALLDNSPTVKSLLAGDPFPDTAPRFLRVDAYRYEFTDFAERRASGNWWKRTALGPFTPLPWMQQPPDR